MKRIIVGTDGSAHAAAALEWLAHIPLAPDAAVEAVSAVPSPLFDVGYALTVWRARWAESAAVVDEARHRLAKRWPQATGRVLEGDPREAVIDAAVNSRADLIVLGARGLGMASSMLLGSVSLGIARHAPCPVLVCKGEPRPVHRVTLALDGSADAEAAVTALCGLPLSREVAISLVGVVEPLPYPAAPEGLVAPEIVLAMRELEAERGGELAAVLAAAAERLQPLVGPVGTLVSAGRAADTIVRVAKHDASDLIVVGARGLGAFQRLLLGSVSEAVLRGAKCPVLVVRRSP